VKRLFDNAVGRSEIERRSGIVARATTRSRVTAAWTETVVEGTIVAVRVHNEEPNEHDEQYYLAVVSRDDVGPDAPADDDNDVQKLVWRNNKTQVFGTNVINKNVCLIRFRWLHYCPNARQSDAAVAEAQSDARSYSSSMLRRQSFSLRVQCSHGKRRTPRFRSLCVLEALVTSGYLPLHTAQCWGGDGLSLDLLM
jgi:hypothetical protein